jgi:NTE family protein
MSTERELLSRALFEIFGVLDDATIDDLLARVERVALRRGEAPFRQGDVADGWYVVASGRLQIVARDAEGREKILNEIGRGESLGEVAMLSGTTRTATPYAVRDTELFRFSSAHFHEIAERHPRMMLSISRAMARRAVGAREAAPPSPCLQVAVIPARPGVAIGPFVEQLARSLGAIGRTLHLGSTRPELGSLASLTSRPPDDPAWRRLSQQLEERATDHRFIVLEGDPGATPWTRRALREADHVVIVADALHHPAPHPLERELLSDGQSLRRAQRTLVLLHRPGASLPRGTARWLDARDVDRHLHVRRDRSGDVDRLARALGGGSIGLVLGAGGARGFAHVGALRAIDEAQVPIDHVGGASIGALVGAMYAMGKSPDEMMDFGRRVTAMRPFAEWGLPITSLLRGRRVEQIVKLAFGDVTIEDLWLPFFCTSCDIARFRVVVHERGDLATAALASSALPGVLPPQVVDGQLLVDGGTTDMLPGEMMRDRCRGPLIAVDVSAEREIDHPIDRYPTSWSALWHRLRPGTPRMPTAGQVFWRAVSFSVARRVAAVAKDADLFLRPPVEHFGTTEIDAMHEIAELGYRHTRDKLRSGRPSSVPPPAPPVDEAAPRGMVA